MTSHFQRRRSDSDTARVGLRPTTPTVRGWVAIGLLTLNWWVPGVGLAMAQTGAQGGGGAQGGAATQGGVPAGGSVPAAAGFPSTPMLPPISTTAGTGTAASTSGSPSMLYPSEDFTLSQGDLINVRVYLQADYAATVRVTQDGQVLLPLIGKVSVQGLSVRDAQLLIGQKLREGGFYREPEVIIQVLDTINGTVLITGEVRAQVPVTNQRSLRDVLLTAGGLPATASHTIKVVRPGEKNPIVVDLGTDLASSAAADIQVKPHDIIQITRANVVYVLGAFSHQGAVPLDQATPLTLLQLASISGGINYEGKYKDLRLIRTVGNERKFVEVDIKKIRDGKAPDPVLQANDIVFLPTENMKAVLKNLGVGGVMGMLGFVLALKNY